MKPNPATDLRPAAAGRILRFRYVILAAAAWHVAVTTSVFLIGRFALVPGQFDQRGLGAFASDGFMYQNEIVQLCSTLRNQGPAAWANWPTQLHVRLYSLPVFVFGGGAKVNILTIEPLNLLYYLLILVLVFKLGEIVFNYRTGMIAAVMVGIWPSFLLHTTQLLRDPLLITALLLLMLTLVLCLKHDYVWHRGILIGIAGIVAIVLIRIVRLPMWAVLVAIVVLALIFFGIRVIHRRRFPLGNIAFGLIMIAALVITPRFQNNFHNQQAVNRPRIIVPEKIQELPLPEQIAARRHGFELQSDSAGEASPSGAGSDLDTGVSLKRPIDILRQVPRAAVVGFFAPFPNMWFRSGKQVGASGRVISGVETLLTYGIECLALLGLWSRPEQLSVWLLFLVVTLGTVAVGLVVVNIGALYRLRYPFWTILIVLGAGGADYLLRRRSLAGSARSNPGAAQPAETFHS
jgi:putative peptidoglycan lipid II flippase